MTASRGWWDDVPYSENGQQPFSMQIEASPDFHHPCGFITLRERHEVGASFLFLAFEPGRPAGDWTRDDGVVSPQITRPLRRFLVLRFDCLHLFQSRSRRFLPIASSFGMATKHVLE
ncbi:hypothetical protein AB3G45_07915 [Shinella sp. S4-D37]|uniref:hypothetical protein n=1 Tax=Shinella sp. S4-D37 TaxID=3161999 RepID=UPI0034663593